MPKLSEHKHALRAILIAATLIGVLVVTAVALSGAHGVLATFIEHLFMAVAVSGIIALAIEATLHERFGRSVFEAAIGYLLPEDLRGEMRWIYSQAFVCEKHTQIVHLTRVEGTSLVRVRAEVTRTFRNITSGKQEFTPSLSVSEWFQDGPPTRILSFSYFHEGDRAGENIAETVEYLDVGEIRVEKPKVTVGSGSRLTVCFETEETMSENDFAYWHFGAPTADVLVTVHAPQDLRVRVLFSNRSNDPAFTKINSNTWQLRGVLLPLQGIRVVWFRRDRFEQWWEANRPKPQSLPETTRGH